MRCKKHPNDLSSSVGVCASCLRERLFALIVAQAQAQNQVAPAAHLPHSHSRASAVDRKQDPPPPLVFPRSVSPYVSRRKSDDAGAAAVNWQHNRFYSTPQLGPTYNSHSAATANFPAGDFGYKKKPSKFSRFTSFFKTRSDKYNSDPFPDSCETSSSFLSTIFSSRRKKQSTFSYVENPTAGDRRDCPIPNRGMSPERELGTEDDCDRSPWGSGGSSEECRKTPMSTTAPAAVRRTRNGHHHHHHHSRNVPGLTFCLSPLVRPSPNRHWNHQKGGLPPDMSFTGEMRAPSSGSSKPHLATAASFCANRSRKLADFGRVNHNR